MMDVSISTGFGRLGDVHRGYNPAYLRDEELEGIPEEEGVRTGGGVEANWAAQSSMLTPRTRRIQVGPVLRRSMTDLGGRTKAERTWKPDQGEAEGIKGTFGLGVRLTWLCERPTRENAGNPPFSRRAAAEPPTL